MTTLTRSTVAEIRMAVDAALSTVARKYGVQFNLGTIRFDANQMRTKLTAQTLSPTNMLNQSTTVRSVSIPAGAALKAHGIDEARTYFHSKLGRITFADFIPRRHKYPYTVVTSAGKRYKLSQGDVNFVLATGPVA